MSVYEQARSLALQIRSSAVYQEMRDAEQAVMNDAKLRTMYDCLKDEAQKAPGSARYQALRAEWYRENKVAVMEEKRHAMNQMMENIQQMMNMILALDDGTACSHDCAHCGGCRL
ncbi:MAG: YlbF family regulator [Clostridia bacterium]|nr:YlbF family regulator [Clostridia bacterium]